MAISLSGLRILVVDDEPEFLGSLGQLLLNSGNQVVIAHSATDAIQMLEEGHGFDVVLLDLLMPSWTGNSFGGIEVAVHVRQVLQDGTGIVYFSAAERLSYYHQIRELESLVGRDPILVTKPARLTTIIEALKMAVSDEVIE